MICVIATLFSTAVWFLIARLILSAFGKPISLTGRMYLIISTVAVAMTTFFAAMLAVAATG